MFIQLAQHSLMPPLTIQPAQILTHSWQSLHRPFNNQSAMECKTKTEILGDVELPHWPHSFSSFSPYFSIPVAIFDPLSRIILFPPLANVPTPPSKHYARNRKHRPYALTRDAEDLHQACPRHCTCRWMSAPK